MSEVEVEIKVENARAYNKQCMGAERYNADVMIGMLKEDGKFLDVFMSNDKATALAKELLKVAAQNAEIDLEAD